MHLRINANISAASLNVIAELRGDRFPNMEVMLQDEGESRPFGRADAGRDERFLAARQVAAVDQGLDNRCARGGRAEAGFSHRLSEFAVVEGSPYCLHRGE